jgi:hypothetical protein
MQDTTRFKFAQSISFHKKNQGEIQFEPSVPRRVWVESDKKFKTYAGAVYLDIAKPVENGDGDRMDWKNKVVYKLSAHDISVILCKARARLFPIKLVHDHKGVKSTLTIELGNPVAKGDMEGLLTYRWTVGRQGTYYNLFLNQAEMFNLFTHLEAILPHLSGWGYDLISEVVDQAIQRARQSSQGQGPQHQAPQPVAAAAAPPPHPPHPQGHYPSPQSGAGTYHNHGR